jgi:hypothetical protein
LAWPRLVTGEAPRSGLLNPNAGKSGAGRGLLRTSLGEILKLFLGYKGNIASMGKTISALLKDAMTFDAHGSKKNPRLTITRHGPLGMAFWTPAA